MRIAQLNKVMEIKILGTIEEIFESPKEFIARNGNYYNCIYAWVLEDEVCYVGETSDFMDRHRWNNGSWSHYDSYYGAKRIVEETGSHKGITKKYNGLLKHGLENVSVGIIVSDLETSDLAPQEIYYIAKYHTFYGDPERTTHAWNLNKGGQDCSQLGTPESIAKAAKSNRDHGNYDPNKVGSLAWAGNTPEANQKKSKTLTGVKFTEEHCKAISEVRKGMKFSSEHCKNLSKEKTGKIAIYKEESHERYRIHPEEFWWWEDIGFRKGLGPRNW